MERITSTKHPFVIRRRCSMQTVKANAFDSANPPISSGSMWSAT